MALNETDAQGNMNAVPPGSYPVGSFNQAHPCTGTALLIVNQRFDAPLWPTIRFAGSVNLARLQEVDPESGKLRGVRDDSPWLAGLQKQLPPGSARLLCAPA